MILFALQGKISLFVQLSHKGSFFRSASVNGYVFSLYRSFAIDVAPGVIALPVEAAGSVLAFKRAELHFRFYFCAGFQVYLLCGVEREQKFFLSRFNFQPGVEFSSLLAAVPGSVMQQFAAQDLLLFIAVRQSVHRAVVHKPAHDSSQIDDQALRESLFLPQDKITRKKK